ncbi:MAG: OmpA family protein [Gemmatimonadales bacterium]|jgi:outer membrane protein OmpA-like peptidoglycan-associated protein
MRTRFPPSVPVVIVGLLLASPLPANAQILDRVKDAAENAAEDETAHQAERLVREAVRCALGDDACVHDAEEADEDVVYVDEDGEVITDEEGVPITDRQEAAEAAGASAVAASAAGGASDGAPGEGVWANYDFIPGDSILFYDDYSGDRVGDFPRRMNFVRGNWEVVEWEGERWLRGTGRSGRAVEIPLPDSLPDRFTIEMDVHLTHRNHELAVSTTSPAATGGDTRRIASNYFKVGRGGAGIASGTGSPIEALTREETVWDGVVPLRIMVDGQYAKVYLGSERIANVPNADLERSATLYLEGRGGNREPIYIGSIRIAAGGRDLYDDLLDDGRATTRGILFAVNSDRIRPESTPTLDEIGDMLAEHPELQLSIEGHTDSDGEEVYNQQLSERRAASVKDYLVEHHGIDAARLETTGYGESEPVADNSTPEGKQKNRRVELVRLDG